MQLTRLMIAVAAVACGSAAFAAPNANRIAISSGASATKGNLKTALTNLCAAGGGTLTEFASGNNISTYVCATGAVTGGNGAGQYGALTNASFVNFSGTAFAELRLNVAGGSFTAVCLLNNFPAGTSCPARDTYRDPGSLTDVFPPTNSVIVGGLLDVEAGAFPSTTTTGLSVPATTAAGVGQTFGVAVSNDLYTAMFNDQKSAGGATAAKPIPGSCAVGDTARVECVPVIGKAQMATIMADNEFNPAYSRGANFLAPSLASGTELRYAKRATTSGTQAGAQVYFLGLPCSPNPLSVVTPSDSVGNTGELKGAIRVYAHPGTGDVRNNLGNVSPYPTSGYAIGIMSGENNQAGQPWKWLRVAGVAMSENAAPNNGQTNTATVKNGLYDYFFESRVAASNQPGGTAFWSAVTTALNSLAAPVGLLNAADLAGYSKGGNTCQSSSSS